MNNKSLLALSMLPVIGASGCGKTDQRPNIIFFLADDFGWTDTQVAFGPEVYPQNNRHNTPNFVQMASEGAIFTNAYACPLSSPTRTSILTGVNSAHTHVTNYLGSLRGAETSYPTPEGYEPASGVLDAPRWAVNGVNPVIPGAADNVEDSFYGTVYPRLLRDSGYFTIHIGKAHWATAGTPGCSPYNMGFVVNVAGGVVEFSKCGYRSEDNYGNVKDGRGVPFTPHNLMEYYGTGTHLTQALTREALKALEFPIQEKKPFYLFLSQYAVHTPIQDDPRFFQKYLDAGMDEGQARFASMVEGVDVSLGEIRAFLKEKGIEGWERFPISVEINPHLNDADEMVAMAKDISSLCPNFVIKIPCTLAGITAAKKLEEIGIRTNLTLVFTASQALIAAKNNSLFVSPFIGWKETSGEECTQYIQDIVDIYSNYGFLNKTQIICAAVRTGKQFVDCAVAGADIVTAGLQVFKDSFYHPFTDYGLAKFQAAWDKTII